MATWRACLAENIHKSADGKALEVLVHYYDSDDQANAGVGPGPPAVLPSKVLHAELFTFATGVTQQQMVKVVRERGAEVRGTYNAAATFAGQNPIGTTVTIP